MSMSFFITGPCLQGWMDADGTEVCGCGSIVTFGCRVWSAGLKPRVSNLRLKAEG